MLLEELWRPEPLVTVGVSEASTSLATAPDQRWRVERTDEGAELVKGGVRVPWFGVLPHQEDAYLCPARFKALRWGRRSGKTRIAWLMAVEGHGPQTMRGSEWTALHRGIMDGLDVVWLARDNKQSDVLWEEEIKPLFKGTAGVFINEQKRFLRFHGVGGKRGKATLYLRSNENVNSIRGVGKYLGMVIADEAAFFRLRYAVGKVIMPALTDNEGSLVLMSSTNAGSDGDPEHPEGPSYFNALCQEIIEDKKSGDWAHFHCTPRDNPILTPQSIAALYREMAADEIGTAQELDAKLLKSVAGLAFPEYRPDLVLTKPDYRPPSHHHVELGFDWGFSSPGWCGVCWFGPEDAVHVSHELVFNGEGKGGWDRPNTTPFEIGRAVAKLIKSAAVQPRRLVADIPDDHKDGRGGAVQESVQEEFERGLDKEIGSRNFPVVRQKKSKTSRKARKLIVHEALRYTAQPDGAVKPWNLPKLSINPRCAALRTTLESIPRDPADHDDVNTNSVHDHPYDGFTGLLLARPRHSAPQKRKDPPDTGRLSKFIPKKETWAPSSAAWSTKD